MKKLASLYSNEVVGAQPAVVVSEEEKARLLALCDEFLKLSGGTAACSDALDTLGYYRTTMNPPIKPHFPEKGRMCGLAYTIRGANVPGLPKGTPDIRETVDIHYLDGIQKGYILAYGTETADRGAIIGDVLSTIAVSKGAVGAVADGPVRDLERIKPLPFQVFSPTAAPVSGEYRVLWIEYDCTIQIGGVWIEPYDILFGDMDGIVVVPKALAEETLKRAREIGDREEQIKEVLSANPHRSVLETFNEFGRRP